MKLEISKGYKLIRNLAKASNLRSFDNTHLVEEINTADLELHNCVSEFNYYVASAEEAYRTSDFSSLAESLVFIRIHAVDIETILGNFSDQVQRLAKESKYFEIE